MKTSVDFDNLTNANTIWSARNRDGSDGVHGSDDGTQRATLQQFLSPVSMLAPRTVVFRAAFKF